MKVTLSGSRLREVLEHAIDPGGHPTAHVAGVKVRYDPKAGRRRVQRVELAGGRQLRNGGTYTLAVDDFLSAGGNGYTMLVGQSSEPGGMLDVEGLIAYLRRLPQPVTVPDETGFSSSLR
jgi:5'-nucleotidase